MNELITKDISHLWHPCSQMKDYEVFKPLHVTRARGSYIELASGQKIIDAISSWWCKSLGHNHPALKIALHQQLEKFEHVILANTTNETIVELSSQLAQLLPGLTKLFFASDGSAAVEIAMKMSLHSRVIQGQKQRTKFLALANGYHGETVGALSVSDVGIYRAPYAAILFESHFIQPIPYVNSTNDLLWNHIDFYWDEIEKTLESYKKTATAILFEPILQGAGGMQIYSQAFLKKLAVWAKENDVHLIADEIMTGFGRTGKMLACEHANIIPDFVCIGKGLTSGWLPMSAVITTDEIYQVFYDDYETRKSFLHSHTHSGNALAASVALATLNVIKEENLIARATELEKIMLNNMLNVATETNALKNIRSIGAMVAADLTVDSSKRIGYAVYQEAIKLGALLRPLGNTLYWLPPLNIKKSTLEDLKNITATAIKTILT